MKWLHISDIHFNIKGYDSAKIKEQLLSKLEELNPEVDFILITGDCLFRYEGGNKEQKDIIAFIKKIAIICKCPNKRVYICQGNHDVNQSDEERNKLIDSIRKRKVDFSCSYPDLCEFGNEKFQKIHKGVTTYNYEAYKVFSPRDGHYRVVSVNSSLISKDKKDCQKLRICNEKLNEIGQKVIDDDRVNILIMHHGIECLEAEDARKFEHWVEDNNIDVVYCGHTHRAAVETYNDIFRDVKQFTAGAIVVDNYAVPSFYICECNDTRTEIEMILYTYAKKTEEWAINNQDLRKFKNGRYDYKLSRRVKQESQDDELNVLKCKTTIKKFNEKYAAKYDTDKIFSNKYEGEEEFDSWKIVSSLVEVGAVYDKALELTDQVIKKITDDDFKSINNLLSCLELRNVVYETILHCKSSKKETEFEVSCWASRYARKYGRNTEIIVLKEQGTKEKLNYFYIKNTLLKEVMDKVTGNTIFYEKIFRNELTRMAESVLSFLKNMGIFEIRNEALLELIKEYITQRPHPWLVNNNRKQLIQYNIEQGEGHIKDLQSNQNRSMISQTEAAYHICAAFLARYDDYIGCTETSPITILTRSINCMTVKDQGNLIILPIQKYQIIQMKKDMENHGIDFGEFKKKINILNKNIVTAQKIAMQETSDALIELWGMLRKLEEPIGKKVQIETPLARIMNIFADAKGFVVKAPLQELKNCFWVEPNWEEYEIKQQHLGKQILVCLLKDISELDKIYAYLYRQNRRETITEITFALEDYTAFSSEKRKEIRGAFKGKYNKCIFIQEENYRQISEEKGWREIFYDIICISKIS